MAVNHPKNAAPRRSTPIAGKRRAMKGRQSKRVTFVREIVKEIAGYGFIPPPPSPRTAVTEKQEQIVESLELTC